MSLMIAAPASIAFWATELRNVSIESIISGNSLTSDFTTGIRRSISCSSETYSAFGLLE